MERLDLREWPGPSEVELLQEEVWLPVTPPELRQFAFDLSVYPTLKPGDVITVNGETYFVYETTLTADPGRVLATVRPPTLAEALSV